MLNAGHSKQSLNLISLSSYSGHRLVGGKVLGKRKGARGRLLHPPQYGPSSTACSSLQPQHRCISFSEVIASQGISTRACLLHLCYSCPCPLWKHITQHTQIMQLIYEPRARLPGVKQPPHCPDSEAISVLATELSSIGAPSADMDNNLSQSSSGMITSIIPIDISSLAETCPI